MAAKEYARLSCLGVPWKGAASYDELNNCYRRGLVLFADMTQFDDYYRQQSLDTFSITYLVPLIARETLTRKTGGCLVSFDDREAMFLCDAFDDEGALWLVPKWLHYSGKITPMPERAIRVEKTSVRPLGAAHPARYLIPEPLPGILRDAVTSEEIPPGYQVRFAPQEKA